MDLRRWKRIELAPQTRLKDLEYLAPRLFAEVLGLRYEECLVTDESDLLDFLGEDEPIEDLLRKFTAHYFVDAAEASSTRILDLLELLRERGIGT
jgi:hypothetical protein